LQYTGGGYYGGDLRYQQHGAPEKDPSLTPDPALTPAPVLDPDG
jgi:hypothetical protein